MFNRNSTIKLLEVLFGQKKSTIHEDVGLLMQVFCKTTQSQFTLPIKATSKYFSRVGAGILGETFATAACMMDVHEVELSNMFAAQLFFL